MEEFAIKLAKHFTSFYQQVNIVRIKLVNLGLYFIGTLRERESFAFVNCTVVVMLLRIN